MRTTNGIMNDSVTTNSITTNSITTNSITTNSITTAADLTNWSEIATVKPSSPYEYCWQIASGLHFADKDEVVSVTEIVPGKVVCVEFADGNKEKAVCAEEDVYSLETGVAICLAKHAMGGSASYNRAVKKAMKVYKDGIAKEQAEIAEKARREKRRQKHLDYLKRREDKKREARIEEMAEAYRRAMGN